MQLSAKVCMPLGQNKGAWFHTCCFVNTVKLCMLRYPKKLHLRLKPLCVSLDQFVWTLSVVILPDSVLTLPNSLDIGYNFSYNICSAFKDQVWKVGKTCPNVGFFVCVFFPHKFLIF